MNITRASLFPGLDGFAQSFRHFVVEEADEAIQERRQRRSLQAALDGLKRAAVSGEGDAGEGGEVDHSGEKRS